MDVQDGCSKNRKQKRRSYEDFIFVTLIVFRDLGSDLSAAKEIDKGVVNSFQYSTELVFCGLMLINI